MCKAKAVCFTLGFLLCASSAFSQEVVLQGRVRDANTHRDIPGVNIFVVQTDIGTSSDFAGRFELRIPAPKDSENIVLQHIGYDRLIISLDSLKTLHDIFMQPRVIPLQGVEVAAPRAQLDISRDLPQPIAVMEGTRFEIRGYVDAGDLLRNDQSVQVSEELSGKKTVSLRGGNPDEVVVLYNGVKMNSSFDNIFDLSLIDLEDIARFEIIKGSNTALYGAEAFSGVVNIVPRVQQDYHVRFQQRIGTYNSGNWGLHLYQNVGRLHGTFSAKQGGAKRTYADSYGDEFFLRNTAKHYTGTVMYDFSGSNQEVPANALSAMAIYSELGYENNLNIEALDNKNALLSLRYHGDIADLKGFDISLSRRQARQEQQLQSSEATLQRKIDDAALYFNADKQFSISQSELLLGYQFQNADLTSEDRGDYQVLNAFTRRQHGLVGILKYRGDSGGEVLQKLSFDVSARYDYLDDVRTQQGDLSAQPVLDDSSQGNQHWRALSVKFSVNAAGVRNDLAYRVFFIAGKNTKFPTLFQQISTPNALAPKENAPNLSPEKNNSLEFGIEFSREIQHHPLVYGWQWTANYFQNFYSNKFRMSYTPGVPIPFYDNVQTARISGFESKYAAFFLRKKVTLELGLSRYFISEKAAFPFKSDFKAIANLIVDVSGYSLFLHWFHENDQVGWIRNLEGQFVETSIPGITNLDIHFSKHFEIKKFKLFVNFSGRNLLNDDFMLNGLALRDRRWYLTAGLQI